MTLVNALPGAVAQGLIWAIMAIGVYITYRVLDIADLTVDGTLCTGGAVCIMCMLSGCNVWVSILAATCAGLLAGFVTGIFHTFMGIQPILAGILTQLALWSINLKIMGKTAFDFLDYATSNIGMPIGCLGIAGVAGWTAWRVTEAQLKKNADWSPAALKAMRFILAVISPVVILVVAAKSLGLI